MTSSPRKPLISSPKVSAQSIVASRRASNASSSDPDDVPTVVHSPTSASTYSLPFARQMNQPYQQSANNSQVFLRPQLRALQDASGRSQTQSPASDKSSNWQPGHRARQHSQGFFEPSMPSTSAMKETEGHQYTAQQIAAREAMQHMQMAQHNRRRSQTLPDPSGADPTSPTSPRSKKFSPFGPSNPNVRFNDSGFIGGHSLTAATTAANVAYPRGPSISQAAQDRLPPPVPEKDARPSKEKSKMKLFTSKPKTLTLGKDKDADKRFPALPSPNKLGYAYRPNMSTTSLVDPTTSSAASIYSQFNASTSTLVPDKEKDKSKHGFLSRQKHKIKDDHNSLPVSSASSTSRLADPNAPQPLYSFAAPASPGPTSTFSKSVSGLDLRHGGRALREKKKEEKAAALLPAGASSGNLLEPPMRDRDGSLSFTADWAGMPSYSSAASTAGAMSSISEHPVYAVSWGDLTSLGHVFGVPGMTPDDAWPLLKARLLNIFEGEDLRPPIEDFNLLVTVYLRRCIQQRAPTVIIEDLDELMRTGFMSLDQTLRHVPDDRLVPHIVHIWMEVFTRILPFMQAVFHPLDLEFKGRGPLMTSREAAEFWGASPMGNPSTTAFNQTRGLGEDMDVRRFTLLTFRDVVILPRHDSLHTIFSRLSLDSLNAYIMSPLDDLPTPLPMRFPNPNSRPGTSASTRPDILPGSLNSTSSNPLESASPFSTPSFSNARSRATSNTSAGSFQGLPAASSFMHTMPSQPLDSADVTEIVGRTLQCVSVLGSVQSGDESQRKIEGLARELKYNWLGRGRTGRQRRGFVGARMKRADDSGANTITPVKA